MGWFDADEAERPSRSPRNALARMAAPLVVTAMLVAVALLAPALSADDPLRVDLTRVGRAPSLDHPFGTDRLGRDLWSRWLHGGRLSLGIALAAALGSVAVGTLMGILASSRDRWIARLIGGLSDVAVALPTFLVAVGLQAVLPSGPSGVIAVLIVTGWMAPARLLRGEVLRVRREAFVEAARALGDSRARIVVRHVLPNCLGTIAAAGTAAFGDALLLQSTLSFLGLGIPPPTPSWGGMLLDAMPELLRGAWWLVVVPGISILTATAAVGALADAARRAWDHP